MLNFLKGKSIEINPQDITKEGWLSKESKYRKVWRDRWCVLTTSGLATFEKEKMYDSPTEIIDISKIKTIKSDDKDNSIFKVETAEGIFYFKGNNFDEKEAWIGAIGKTMVRSSSSAIFINDEDN